MRVLLIYTLSLLSFSTIHGQQATDTGLFTNYLKSNKSILQATGNLDVPVFNQQFFQANLFLFGENHGSSKPHETDVSLFTTLYKKAGVRTYISEVDPTKAWMLNKFLETADTIWLDKVFQSWIADTAQWASRDNYSKYKKLQSFYSTLPKNQKFRIEGIDLVQDYSLLKEQLREIKTASKTFVPAAYLDSLTAICDTITIAGRRPLGEFCRRMLHIMDQKKITTNPMLTAFVTSLSFVKPGVTRDSLMYANFNYLVSSKKLAGKKIYGFLGFYHCLQTSYNNSTPFAAYLQNDQQGTFQDKINSMMMMAIDSKTMLPYVAQVKKMMPSFIIDKARQETPDFHSEKYVPYGLTNDNQMMMIKGINALKNTSEPNSIPVYRLNGAYSPYATTKELAEVTGFQQIKMTASGGNTLQAFQYVILFRNSAAATPL